jgi:diaminohydroxyphosphoribosylaminopyrimidine deaminase/5-amino-6-(5-phosphoribosylamino)uracil reductase
MQEMDRLNDESYMRLALQMAEQARGQTGINPVVGCVIVKDGRIVGMGAHLQRGSHHAEINALLMAGSEAEGSTVYVTLEPCSHHGRTPPCSERLVTERVKRVVVACTDPNPVVAGTGIQQLRNHGIEVRVGVCEEEARMMNEAYNKYIISRIPWVTLKTATTLDGKIAARSGDSKWISGETSRELVHTLRHRHQAIMVGVDTIIADNPQLTTRLSVPGLQPLRVIIDSKLRIPLDAHVVTERDARTLVITTQSASIEQMMRLNALGAEVMKCGDGPRVDLGLAMVMLGEREISSVLLEGGGTLNGAMLDGGLVDKLILFISPKIIGGGAQARSAFEFAGFDRMADAIAIERFQVERVGNDCCMIGYPRYERSSPACSPES